MDTLTVPPAESRSYACAKCGRKRRIRTTEHWPDYGIAHIGPDGFLCNRCGREVGAIELKRCGKCGRLFRPLKAFFVGPDGRVHLSLDCFIAGSVTGSRGKRTVTSRVSEREVVTLGRETRAGNTRRETMPERETRPDGARDCANCGEPFYPVRSTAQFCTPRCRVAAHRAKHNGG